MKVILFNKDGKVCRSIPYKRSAESVIENDLKDFDCFIFEDSELPDVKYQLAWALDEDGNLSVDESKKPIVDAKYYQFDESEWAYKMIDSIMSGEDLTYTALQMNNYIDKLMAYVVDDEIKTSKPERPK